ncbi:hypothetical protein BCR33DRAFT_846792 [Rhizoclosmatium globosum]|uniref:Family A G protein-coupled receptor-like protein n=1 Tax=Rhizoclosmatium globosum TaxID=329046 RepID=A0A1Y2CTE0_9FUNG|nr:hypothetical protein BCR33DRAFT_846792 [Rhizoclosmatium globosum]|eukprot:ORY50252.1 hypothetical protein BCR33DRAFT_846792 [Rhizoclosmatium globosum]
MNSTNSTLFPTDSYYDGYLTVGAQDFWITIVASALQLTILGYLMYTKTKNPQTRRKVYSATNTLLLLMIFINCMTIAFNALYVGATTESSMLAYLSLSYVGTLSSQCLIIIYSWKRGRPVFHAMIPSIEPYLPAFFVLFGLLQANQFAWTVMQFCASAFSFTEEWTNVVDGVTNALSVTVNVVMLLFDALVTIVYILYLRAMKSDLPDVAKLKVISRYGIASCFCMEVWLIGIVLFNYWFVTPTVSIFWFLVSLRIYDFGPIIYVFLQLAMKWSLQQEEVRGEKMKRERIETARIVSTRGTSVAMRTSVITMAEKPEKSRMSRIMSQ